MSTSFVNHVCNVWILPLPSQYLNLQKPRSSLKGILISLFCVSHNMGGSSCLTWELLFVFASFSVLLMLCLVMSLWGECLVFFLPKDLKGSSWATVQNFNSGLDRNHTCIRQVCALKKIKTVWKHLVWKTSFFFFLFFIRPASYAVEEVYIYFQRNEVWTFASSVNFPLEVGKMNVFSEYSDY